MTRPPDHPPLRHLMSDNRDQTPHTTVPCPVMPDAAYASADPVRSALARDPWAAFPAMEVPEATEPKGKSMRTATIGMFLFLYTFINSRKGC